MNTATFPCPYCSSPLRIQDRAFTDRAVGCPECGEQIEVKLDKNKEPVAHKVSPAEPTPLSPIPPRRWMKAKVLPKKRKEKKARSKTQVADDKSSEGKPHKLPRWSPEFLVRFRERFSGVAEKLLSPVGIAWTVAGLVGLILLIMAWPEVGDADTRPNPDGLAKPLDQSENPIPLPAEEELVPEPLPGLPDEVAVLDAELLGAKFAHLNTGIQNYVAERGHYPQGTVPLGVQPGNERFSWLAELFVHASKGQIAEPQWDQPWNDPLNDRFVRQQQEGYLNPLLPNRVGVDRYPATHFVGVAGVGRDAPKLKANHPRAGIFGVDRTTRPEDIKDGQTNTMMVAGVINHLGSWAAGGHATIRPFTQEPYFEGSDGFGTGEADGMSVLMADGSVRFLSKNTSPVIVRRMAAMADGWPLDETIPGEPGELPVEKPQPEKSQPMDPPAVAHDEPMPKQVTTQKPNSPEEAPVPKLPEAPPQAPIDIPKALAVKIVKFEQIQNAPMRELLYQVEELAGVPIRMGDDVPGEEAEIWKQGVSLRLNNTTVGEILEALLKPVQLGYTIESDHIRLQKSP